MGAGIFHLPCGYMIIDEEVPVMNMIYMPGSAYAFWAPEYPVLNVPKAHRFGIKMK